MRRRIASIALAIGLLCLAPQGAAHPPEYRAKAEYLLLFLRYVTWPETAFPVAGSPLVIGVLGGNPFGTLLDSDISCAESQGRRILVRRIIRAEEAAGVHVVYISHGATRRHGGWIGMFRNRPILTVVESEREFAAGAILRLDTAGGRLRFDVNLPILRDSGLRIDTPMLQSARRIIRDGDSG